MGRLVYYVGASLDGFIAGPEDETDFFPVSDDVLSWIREAYPETLPTHLRQAMGIDAPNRRFDTVVMGRGTYRPALEIGITSPYRHLRQYVVSTKLSGIADPEVTHVASDPRALVARLKAEEARDVWLAGGGVLAASLLPEIDELVVKRYPVVAGTGIPMFGGAFRPTSFAPMDRLPLEGGMVVTTYRRVDVGAAEASAGAALPADPAGRLPAPEGSARRPSGRGAP